MLQLARVSSSRAAAAALHLTNMYNGSCPSLAFDQLACCSARQQQQCTQQQRFSSRADDVNYSAKLATSNSPEAVTSKGERTNSSNSEPGHTTFTGTADVFPASSEGATQQPTIATDSNRSWMSGDDLGNRVEAATNDNHTTTARAQEQQKQQQQQQQQQGQGAELGVDASAPECHPADPYCQAGEQPPTPDGFHEPEPGDDHIPPSSGFPA